MPTRPARTLLATPNGPHTVTLAYLIRDDAFAPTFPAGCTIFVDPARKPTADEWCLFCAGSEGLQIARLVQAVDGSTPDQGPLAFAGVVTSTFEPTRQ